MEELYQQDIALKFYETRFEQGYMDDWSTEVKERVFSIIKSLSLPETGTALDFGCGNGVFTHILKKALPRWEVYGTDISSQAIKNATLRFKECNFFVSGKEESTIKYDFLFSHHVLEHVYDIDKTIAEINDYLKPTASVLHIMPCGNKDSYEYNICKLRTDGINEAMQGRFFFEDEGHVRRLTTEVINGLMGKYNFVMSKNYYRNQRHGAIKWISQSPSDFITRLTDQKYGIDASASNQLKSLRNKFLLLHYLQKPVILFERAASKKDKKLKHYIFLVIGFIPFILLYPVYMYINYAAKKEWLTKNQSLNGSEMFVFYTRNVIS